MQLPTSRGELDVDGRPARWLRDGALDGRPLVLLAHGAGAPLTSAFMAAVAQGLVQRGLAVCRFHFPYMEQQVRSGKRGPPDREPVLLATWQKLLAEARSWQGVGHLVLAGKSLGGRMASLLLAKSGDQGAKAVFYLGYPLHPPGQKQRLRSAHLPDVPIPQLFVSGTKDPLCDLALLRGVLEPIGEAARLFVVEGGDHSLATNRKEPLRGSDVWLDEIAAFSRAASRSA
jgi:predicted alpha/beta-hydrolase family hydrolase